MSPSLIRQAALYDLLPQDEQVAIYCEVERRKDEARAMKRVKLSGRKYDEHSNPDYVAKFSRSFGTGHRKGLA